MVRDLFGNLFQIASRIPSGKTHFAVMIADYQTASTREAPMVLLQRVP
jgi:hypothetical protein